MTSRSEPPYLAAPAVEGAADRFFGRPLLANPYNPVHLPHEWASWRYGWAGADVIYSLYLEREIKRWLREGEAA